jgi:hypothetical protein
MYAYLVAAVVFLVSVGGAYIGGRADGDRISDAEHLAENLQEAREAHIAYAGIASRYRAKEQAQAQSFAAVSTQYQRKLDANATALLAAGAVRLFDPGSRVQACGDTAAAAPASPGGNNEGRGTALSQELASFLIAEANRADGIVLRLTACQAILRSERD